MRTELWTVERDRDKMELLYETVATGKTVGCWWVRRKLGGSKDRERKVRVLLCAFCGSGKGLQLVEDTPADWWWVNGVAGSCGLLLVLAETEEFL